MLSMTAAVRRDVLAAYLSSFVSVVNISRFSLMMRHSLMNRTSSADLDALYDLLPIMRGGTMAACKELGISRSALWRRLCRLREEEGLAVFIGTGWVKSSDREVSSLAL